MKPRKVFDKRKIRYSDEDWDRLDNLREKVEEILSALDNFSISGLVHGSVARGDVSPDSDIDIITPYPTKSFRVELSLKEENFTIYDRKIVMATPWQLPKAHIYLEEDITITIPLEKPKKLEEEFYQFGGAVSLEQVRKNERVPGIDKRLVLVDPRDYGHLEGQVFGRENIVAKKLDISKEIIEERIEVLTKRDREGRTGIFLEQRLKPSENFENLWNEILQKNPEISKRF